MAASVTLWRRPRSNSAARSIRICRTYCGTAPVDQPAAQGGMQVVFHGVDLRLHIAAGKLNRDEGMGFAWIAARFEIGVGVAVEADRMGLVTRLDAAIVDGAGAAQVQA